MKFFKSKTSVIIVVLVIGYLTFSSYDGGSTPTPSTDGPLPPIGDKAPPPLKKWNWYDIAQKNPPTIVSGWSKPELLGINTLGWIESLHISSDGEELYYMLYRGPDLFGAARRGGPFVDDTNIFVSKREKDGQFRTHRRSNKFSESLDVVGSSGIMIDEDGNFFYNAANDALPGGFAEGDYDNENLYRNNKLLGINKKGAFYSNPHYCKAQDELWFDSIPDREISVLYNAAAKNFNGRAEPAPLPIGDKTHNSQVWLSSDGNTMFFTSNRERFGQDFDGPWIYTSERLGKREWNKPKRVISGKIAEGDATLTSDMKEIYWVHYLMNKKGGFQTAIYRSKRK